MIKHDRGLGPLADGATAVVIGGGPAGVATALALKQGGYDWGLLAYAVGFGGSMIWFGSSAGVAISNTFTDAKNVGLWVRHGWHVAVGYVLGFAVFMALVGWHPTPKRERGAEAMIVITDLAHPAPDGLYASTGGVQAPRRNLVYEYDLTRGSR